MTSPEEFELNWMTSARWVLVATDCMTLSSISCWPNSPRSILAPVCSNQGLAYCSTIEPIELRPAYRNVLPAHLPPFAPAAAGAAATAGLVGSAAGLGGSAAAGLGGAAGAAGVGAA